MLCWFGRVSIAVSALGTIASRWRRSAMLIGRVVYAMRCAMSRANTGRLIRGRRYVLIVRTRLGRVTIAGGYIYARLLPIRVAGSMQMSVFGWRCEIYPWILLMPDYNIGWVCIIGAIAALSLKHPKLIISISIANASRRYSHNLIQLYIPGLFWAMYIEMIELCTCLSLLYRNHRRYEVPLLLDIVVIYIGSIMSA